MTAPRETSDESPGGSLVSSMSGQYVQRPGGLMLLVVLGIIQGLGSVIGGIVIALDRDDPALLGESGMTENTLLVTGLALMIVGFVIILLSLALRNGSNTVRWLFGIVTMFHVAGGVWGLFALHGEQQLSAAVTTVFGLMILWILFGNERSDDFFIH